VDSASLVTSAACCNKLVPCSRKPFELHVFPGRSSSAAVVVPHRTSLRSLQLRRPQCDIPTRHSEALHSARGSTPPANSNRTHALTHILTSQSMATFKEWLKTFLFKQLHHWRSVTCLCSHLGLRQAKYCPTYWLTLSDCETGVSVCVCHSQSKINIVIANTCSMFNCLSTIFASWLFVV